MTSESARVSVVPVVRGVVTDFFNQNHNLNPATPTVAICTATKHPVPDRVKPSFVIFDIRAL